jgi:hypothetical protein
MKFFTITSYSYARAQKQPMPAEEPGTSDEPHYFGGSETFDVKQSLSITPLFKITRVRNFR